MGSSARSGKTMQSLTSILETASEKSGSSVDLAYDELLRRIVSGELREGEPVKGAAIAKEMGLSRTPVVQAISRLNSEGVLRQELNQRATVAAGAERWFVSLHEVRILLEPQSASAAAGNLSTDNLNTLNQLAREFEAETHWEARREAAYRLDFALHTAIADACGNLMIRSIIDKCMSFKRFAYRVPNDLPERLERSHREHLEILHAVEQGDSDTAAAAMLFHLRSTFRDLPNDHVV